MEINFIEEAAKALDMISVERLVHTMPLGKVRCKSCKKQLYTWVQARFVILRMRINEKTYVGDYECPEHKGLFHVTNVDKQLDKAKTKYPWEVKSLERYKAYLDCIAESALGARKSRDLVGVSSGFGQESTSKNLRLKIIKALVFPVQGLRKPRKHLVRRGYKRSVRTPARDTARRDVPRGEIMTRMLSWANSQKFHVDSEHPQCPPRGDGAKFRRRNRAREAEAVRQLIEREGSPINCWYWRETRYLNRLFDMNDEYITPSHEVWCALAENDDGLRFVDFDGTYTTGVV